MEWRELAVPVSQVEESKNGAVQRVQMLIAYDGTPYEGWQSQATGNAVQDNLERALAAVGGAKISLHGAGRTDAGVHAMAQSAHADLPVGRVAFAKWQSALNAHLPWEIRVTHLRAKPPAFHARFDAKFKIYRYRIFNNDGWLDPLELKRAWFVPKPLDWEQMERAVELYIGRHDFRAFCANRGWEEKSTVRYISKIKLRRQGRLITLDFTGEGFLYKMVRMLTANIVRVGLGKSELSDIETRLREPFNRSTHTAPAEGLYLMKVGY